MNVKSSVLLLLSCGALLLSGCGKKNAEPDVVPIVTQTPAAVTPAPELPTEDYNTISSVDKSTVSALQEDLLSVASSCYDIYSSASKGNGRNVVLSASTVNSMVEALGNAGYCAIDYSGNCSMTCPESFEAFGAGIPGVRDLSATYYMVYDDGHISAFRLIRQSGIWHLLTASMNWEENGNAKIYTEGNYLLRSVKYTEKGWLIYDRDTSSFDANQEANISSWVMIRILPLDETARSLCRRYIAPIGYLENNLFTTDWSESNLIPIDFNSLYAQLFGMYHGTSALTASTAGAYYSMVSGTDAFSVPAASFEAVVKQYFNISPELLRAISDYSSSSGTYYFLGYATHYYNVTPRTPEPEVVDYHTNADGTITMRVDAVNTWYGTDCAFSHEVTVRIASDGSWKYVSNRLLSTDSDILPDRVLSKELDLQLEAAGLR